MAFVSLRRVQDPKHLFGRIQTCPVVYFSDNEQTFTVEQVREPVYQKEPESEDVFVCYCFRHTVGDLRAASPEDRTAIVHDINTGTTPGNVRVTCETPKARAVWGICAV